MSHEPKSAERVRTMQMYGERLPVWLSSLVVHLSLLIVLGLAMSKIPDPKVGGGVDCTVSFDESEGGAIGDALGASTVELAPAPPAQIQGDTLGVVLKPDDTSANLLAVSADVLLPDSHISLLQGTSSSTGTNGVGNREGVAQGNGDGTGLANTNLFGVRASGKRFVYVFDRSESMGYVYYYNGPEDGMPLPSVPLDAAKSQLLSSLRDLKPGSQFQIVFYNHQPMLFQSRSIATSRLLGATSDRKQLASSFIARTGPEGGTNHMLALEAALRLRPDVIFLLTDGEHQDDPTPLQIEQLRNENRYRISINVIHFVQKPRPTSTLVRLAKENYGKHAFVDITHVGGWANGQQQAGSKAWSDDIVAMPNQVTKPNSRKQRPAQ